MQFIPSTYFCLFALCAVSFSFTPRPYSLRFDSASSAALDLLWSYSCPLSAGRTVSSMAWNLVNLDLLAVAYSHAEGEESKGGLILFWSLKNPEYPQKVLETKVGVTSLDFSAAYPNLLAAGLYDGTVSIYDVRKVNPFIFLAHRVVDERLFLVLVATTHGWIVLPFVCPLASVSHSCAPLCVFRPPL